MGAAVLLLALSACQATIRIGVDTNANGSGTVTATVLLDHDAATNLPNLAQQLRTSDLAKAGWKVDGPLPAQNQGVQVRVSKPFRNPSEGIKVLAELSGGTSGGSGAAGGAAGAAAGAAAGGAAGKGGGPFNGFRIDQRHGFLYTTTNFHGVVDLTCGVQCFGDPKLQQQLGGTDLGIDPAKLQQQAGVILDRIFHFEVSVRLPGSLQSSNAPAQAGNGAVWQPKLGDQVTLTATSRAWNAPRVVLLGLAVVAALALVALLVLRLLRRRRPTASTTRK